jgi:hypothetical protein
LLQLHDFCEKMTVRLHLAHQQRPLPHQQGPLLFKVSNKSNCPFGCQAHKLNSESTTRKKASQSYVCRDYLGSTVPCRCMAFLLFENVQGYECLCFRGSTKNRETNRGKCSGLIVASIEARHVWQVCTIRWTQQSPTTLMSFTSHAHTMSQPNQRPHNNLFS